MLRPGGPPPPAGRGPPVLQSALRASAQSPMFTGEAAGAQRLAGGPIGVSLDEAVDATAAIVVDVQKPQLPPPGAASVVKPSEKGKATVVVDDRRPGTAESAPREQSPANRQRGLSTSPSKPTKAQRRARGELITSGVSSLGAAVLSAEAETIENLRCETYAERFPSPTQSPNTASPIGGSPNQRELPTTSAGRRSPVRDAPAVDAQGRREFSKRTCKFDARRPRSFGEILRERFIGDAGSLIEVADTMEHACEAQGATSSAAALRARLPPTRSITGPSPPPESVEAALARTHTSPSGKARAALACVIADGRRAATPSISKPRATLPSTPHSTASNSRPSSKLSMRRPAALTPDLLVRRLPTPSKSR
uniref:Uncharacterized protein n=1 Tax=Neobodo designis TaxID=312471 RepID=A0A7S1W479_NEODS